MTRTLTPPPPPQRYNIYLIPNTHLVHQVGQVSTRESGGSLRERLEVGLRVEDGSRCVEPQNLLAAAHVRQRHRDVLVEAAGADEGVVQRFGEVGGGDDDDVAVLVEPVHLHQQLKTNFGRFKKWKTQRYVHVGK